MHEVDSGRGFVLLAPETLLELRTDLNAQRVDYESPSRCIRLASTPFWPSASLRPQTSRGARHRARRRAIHARMTTRCRWGECVAEHPGDFYCHAHYARLLSGLEETIKHIYGAASTVYIGRSHYPEQRLLYHRKDDRLGNNDHMAVLHWSGDPEEIMQLETRLIANNHGRLKLKNDCLESKGRVVGMWHCVYVVWRWKKDSDKWPGFSDVDALDLGRRLAPVRHSNLGRNPEYLRTRLAPDRAAAILAPAR